jgi:hypothetical protein
VVYLSRLLGVSGVRQPAEHVDQQRAQRGIRQGKMTEVTDPAFVRHPTRLSLREQVASAHISRAC